jgi:hypothetical protein
MSDGPALECDGTLQSEVKSQKESARVQSARLLLPSAFRLLASGFWLPGF